MGTVEDFSNFINAVIDEKSFDKIAEYIDNAKKAILPPFSREETVIKEKDILFNPRL